MIGSVAKDQDGRLGVICGILTLSPELKQLNYTGIGFDGKNWETTQPEVMAASINQYLCKLVNSNFCKE